MKTNNPAEIQEFAAKQVSSLLLLSNFLDSVKLCSKFKKFLAALMIFFFSESMARFCVWRIPNALDANLF